MKVIVDKDIPYIKETITRLADEVVFLAGSTFTNELVKDADALIVRTRTHCNESLLEGSSVRFIATATIGFDHIDTDYCARKGIVWSNCPGCNAASVQQYLESVFILLQQNGKLATETPVVGIVGVGHVGQKIAALAQRRGMRVLLNDPPRAARGEQGFVSLEEIARYADIITFHTPLTTEGQYATYHLADASFFRSLKRSPILINTSRGEVVETQALKDALAQGQVSHAVIDVWEHEPHIDLDLLQSVFIGTPHIAGYSADGKANATQMALEAFCHFFGLPIDFHIAAPELPQPIEVNDEDQKALAYYNPQIDHARLVAHPELFEQFRSNYPLRRERPAMD